MVIYHLKSLNVNELTLNQVFKQSLKFMGTVATIYSKMNASWKGTKPP